MNRFTRKTFRPKQNQIKEFSLCHKSTLPHVHAAGYWQLVNLLILWENCLNSVLPVLCTCSPCFATLDTSGDVSCGKCPCQRLADGVLDQLWALSRALRLKLCHSGRSATRSCCSSSKKTEKFKACWTSLELEMLFQGLQEPETQEVLREKDIICKSCCPRLVAGLQASPCDPRFGLTQQRNLNHEKGKPCLNRAWDCAAVWKVHL